MNILSPPLLVFLTSVQATSTKHKIFYSFLFKIEMKLSVIYNLPLRSSLQKNQQDRPLRANIKNCKKQ